MLIIIPLADDQVATIDHNTVKSVLPIQKGDPVQKSYPAAQSLIRYDNGQGATENLISKMDVKSVFDLVNSYNKPSPRAIENKAT